MIKKKCQLMENALNDPSWNPEINAELCMVDCDNCPHFTVSEKDKLSNILDALFKHFEKKFDKILNPDLLNCIVQEEDY